MKFSTVGVLVLFFNASFTQACNNVPPSSEEMQNIVALHNRIRNSIASASDPSLVDNSGLQLPQAQNMQELAWDDELANAAGIMTQTCEYEHMIEQVPEFQVSGQNIYRGYTTDNTKCSYDRAFQMWANEINNYNDKNQRRPFNSGGGSGKTGHFTQVIWAQTTKVGCACSTHENMDYEFPGKYRQLVACNYGFRGNIRPNGYDVSIYDAVGEAPSVNDYTLTF